MREPVIAIDSTKLKKGDQVMVGSDAVTQAEIKTIESISEEENKVVFTDGTAAWLKRA